MSVWYQIKDKDDVELSGNGKTLEVCFLVDYNGNNYVEIPIEFVMNALDIPTEQEVELCDVDNCKMPSSSGGAGWRETGYWRLCHDHFTDALKGKPQPQMRQAAIDRENSRDKTTGYLPFITGDK